MPKTKSGTKQTTEFLATAIARFRKIELADGHNRRAARSDLKFVYNIDDGQWPQEIRDERKNDGRPCLTSNKLRKFVAQVSNREREQRLAGNVRPVDDKADVQTAKIISGIIRQIEHASNAEKAYTEAGEHAIGAGFGYWRITSEELDDSFDQELFIRPVKNQFSVYLDPDGMFGFVREKVDKDEFKFRYPTAKEEDFESGQVGDDYHLWYDADNIFVAEYFYKIRVQTEIAEIINQVTGEVRIVELTKDITERKLKARGWTIGRRKSPKMFKVKWAKITSSQILEEGEWAGKDIPIIPVEGDWINLEGREYKRSLVVDAKDDQRMYNYWKTSMTENIALAAKAPYLVTTAMIKGVESYWKNAHKKLLPYLPFNPQGKFIPKREPPPQVPTGAASMLELSQRDIQDTIGMYETSFGERSNERTGIAIRQRALRSDFGTLHFPDNFRRAILASTRQLIDLIPKIYDTPRIVRILGEEGPSLNPRDDIVAINQALVDESTGETFKVHDLSQGKYDIVEDVKIMSTRRQEMLEGMSSLAQAAPNIAPILLPFIAKAMDWPGSQDIAAKVNQFLPSLLGVQPEQGEQPLPEGTRGNGAL